jgi:hypothetical protein
VGFFHRYLQGMMPSVLPTVKVRLFGDVCNSFLNYLWCLPKILPRQNSSAGTRVARAAGRCTRVRRQ